MRKRIISAVYSLFTNRRVVFVKNHKITLRKNGIDTDVFDYVFNRLYHRPSRPIRAGFPTILDLGVNIGLSIVDFKTLYPSSTVIGFELDRDNYDLALINCKAFEGVTIINKAIWFENKPMKYDKKYNSDAYHISDEKETENSISVETITISQIIQDFRLESIDYVKMDIEGAEKQIFEHDLSWLKQVKEIKIEIHNGDEVFNFIKTQLERNGFNTQKDTGHWSTIIGYKE